MPRYIDADGLKEALRNLTRWVVKNGDKHNEGFTYDQVFFCIDARPAADVVERKKGKWVNNIHDMPICNQCGYMTPYDRAIDDYEYGNFCPNCGAEMEGEGDADKA